MFALTIGQNSIHESVQKLVQTRAVRLLAIGSLLALMSGCGSEMTPRTTALASGGGPTNTVLVDSTNGAWAQCSYFDSSTARIAGKVTTYYYNGARQQDAVRVRITNLPADFDTNAGYFIQAFRWKVTPAGTTELDPNAVQFKFEKGAGSVNAISPMISSVSLREMSTYATSAGLGTTGAINFFANTTMVVTGVDYDWHALKIVVYNGTTASSTVVGQVDFLLPVFAANPTRYATSHAATLTQLHPFYAQSSQNLSEQDWALRTTSYCF